jgi:uncharacterized RDD family membrane protein YckC
MSTTESSFSWGADTLSRGEGRSRRARSATRSQSLLRLRASALIVDGLVLGVPAFAIDFLLSLAFPHHGFFFARSGVATTGASTTSAYTMGLPGWLVISALTLSYFFLFEALRGQTIGKRAMGLRVRSASGGAAGLNAISGRTVLRLVDVLPFLYLLGTLVAILGGSRRRRIGDWVGGTVVVRDEGEAGGVGEEPRHALWRVALYPAGWLLAVVLAVFVLGLGDAIGAGEQGIALVQSYVQARERGEAARACSLLTRGQQREVVAIQGGSYRGASADRCPAFILRSDRGSNLLNPVLGQLAAGPLLTAYTHGAVLVHSPQYPEIQLTAVPEGGQLRLDVRGLERIGFVESCSAAGRLTSAECTCAWNLLRAQGMLPERRLTRSVLRAMARDGVRCQGDPATAASL